MTARGLFIANMLLVGAMSVFGWLVAAKLGLQTVLPIHWNALGQVDRYALALQALLLPAGVLGLLGGVLWATLSFDPARARIEASAPLLHAVWVGMMGLLVFLQVAIAALGLKWNIGPDIIMVCIGIVLMMIGDNLPKSRPNFFVGIRTPWTLKNTDTWIATHRLGGKIFISAGGLMVLLALPPLEHDFRLMTIPVIVGVASTVPILYSWWHWRDQTS